METIDIYHSIPNDIGPEDVLEARTAALSDVERVRKVVDDSLNLKDLQEAIAAVSRPEQHAASSKKRHEAKIKAAIQYSGMIEKLSNQLMNSIPKDQSPISRDQVEPPTLKDAKVGLGPETNSALAGRRKIGGSNRNIVSKSKSKLNEESTLNLSPSDLRIKPGTCYVNLVISGGRSFLGESLVLNLETRFQISVQFGDFRVQSSLVPCQSEPAFQEDWMIQLPTRDFSNLLESKDRLHFVVTRIKNPTYPSPSLVGVSRLIDWRHILRDGATGAYQSVDLFELNEDSLVTGSIQLSMKFLPGDRHWVTDKDFEGTLAKEIKAENQAKQNFLNYCKQWWADFKNIRPSHAERSLRLFARNESGVKELVCNFIYPIRSRIVQSPQNAARFVALLGQDAPDSTAGIGQAHKETWASLHTLLVMRKGGLEERAVLLCNLFLGFNLNAFVTFGTAVRNFADHVWVTTIDPSGEVKFWDVTKGISYKQYDTKHSFDTIGALFNHESFFGNIQFNDSAIKTSFDFSDEGYWKSLSKSALQIVSIHSPRIYLSPCALEMDEVTLERDLKRYIEAYRQENNMSCQWDEESGLNHVLIQNLWRLEYQKSIDGTLDRSMEFDAGIKRSIPEGHVFKAFPSCHKGVADPLKIMNAMLKIPQCKQLILHSSGDKVRFVLAFKSYPYAECVSAHWVMVGVRFKDTSA